MRNLLSLIWTLLALAILIPASGPAGAQAARSGGAPNAQLMQQMQQLASERTALQAENARIKKELEDLRKERDQLKSGRQAVDQRVQASTAALARSTAQRDSTEQELTQFKAKTQELVAKFRETAETLRTVESEQTTTQQTLGTRDRELKTCVDRNVALYKLNSEVLTRFEKQSTWSRVARAEPFTQIKRVELENLVDGYKDRADEQRLPPAAGAAAPTAAPPKPAAPGPAGAPEQR
ncbi:MAG: hypothetical protein ABI885_00405 [Gammaproteobacteria bacterium]